MHGTPTTRHALRRLRGQILFLTGLLCAVACAAMVTNLINTASVGEPGLVIAAAALATTLFVATRRPAGGTASPGPAAGRRR